MSSPTPGSNVGQTLDRILSIAGLGLIPHKFTVRGHEIDYLPTIKLLQAANRDGHVTVGEVVQAVRPLAVSALRIADVSLHGVPLDVASALDLLLEGGEDGNVSVADLSKLIPFVSQLVAAAIVQQAKPSAAPVASPASAEPSAPSAPTTNQPAPPATGGPMKQLTKLTAAILFGERKRGPSNDGARFDPKNEAQGVDDRVHFDCTPTPDDPAENEQRVGADGNPKKPWVEPRWGKVGPNGEEILMWNSSQMDDKFSLESWEKRGPQDTSGPGLTPVLLQEEEIASGRTKCFLYFVISAEHNQGLALDGSDRDACPRVYWMAS